MKTIFCILLISMYTFSAAAQIAIEKDQPAPIDGFLLTKEEITKILSEKEAAEKQCIVNINYEKEKADLVCNLHKTNKDITIAAQEQKYEELIRLKDEEINRLYKELEKGDYAPYWFAAGAAIATITSVAIFFAAVQTTKVDIQNLINQ
jgi:hypothetical protein